MRLYEPGLVLIIGAVVAVCVLSIYGYANELNAISLGEEEALHIGVDIERVKKILFFLVCLATAGVVCITGIIGFVGLLIPHMVRLMVGANHKILIPVTCIVASCFMIICDLIARTIFSPMEIPIGVVTALLGAPLFIILLKREQRRS